MITDISEVEAQEHLRRLTILFVEDEEFSRELCSEFLSRIVGRLVTAKNGVEGLDAWRQHKPDIIITDIQMPYMDGLAMVQEIRSVDRAIPVIIMSAFDEPKYLKRSIDLGVSGYALKPVDVCMFAATLLNCARGLFVAYKLVQANSALIKQNEFTEATLFALEARTRELACLYSIISVTNAPDISFEEIFNRIVLRIPPAWQFPDIAEAYIEINGRNAQTTLFRETPWKLTEKIIVEGNEVGKVTVCYLEERIFLPEELSLLTAIAEKLGLIVARELTSKTISRLVVTDELTDLNNRRFFSENFSKALSASQRHSQPLSLISNDLDHIKNVNDTFGHSVGDLVLKEFSQLLKSMVRFEDIACRMGGEEFMVLLPNTTCEASVALAERLRCSFEQLPRTATPVVTASFGVAELQEGENGDALRTRVDAALYQAKHDGRNRVVAACSAISS